MGGVIQHALIDMWLQFSFYNRYYYLNMGSLSTNHMRSISYKLTLTVRSCQLTRACIWGARIAHSVARSALDCLDISVCRFESP